MPSMTDRLKHAWNAFNSREPTNNGRYGPTVLYSGGYSSYRSAYSNGADKTIIDAIYTRIAMDCAQTTIQHVRVDDNGRFKETVDSGLNECLTVEANKDQTSRLFIQDIVESLLSEGYIGLVPIDTDDDITKHASVDILSLRVGKVLTVYPDWVQLEVYNDRTGQRENLTMPKKSVALIENPLYSVMNKPNGTLQRLIRKLSLLDAIDEQSGASKLDLIIQLPYALKSTLKQEQAEVRKQQIEEQLNNSRYGIAYIDATEHITQLNRPLDNNLMSQIEYLTSMLYSQLGITNEIMNGTANQEAMLNYYNRVVEPIMSAIVDEIYRKFLTKTARSRNQRILYYRDPFKLVPISQLAEIADKFTRNEIMSPNEIRQIVGMKPVDNAAGDELRNRNINQSGDQEPVYTDDDPEKKPDNETSKSNDLSGLLSSLNIT